MDLTLRATLSFLMALVLSTQSLPVTTRLGTSEVTLGTRPSATNSSSSMIISAMGRSPSAGQGTSGGSRLSRRSIRARRSLSTSTTTVTPSSNPSTDITSSMIPITTASLNARYLQLGSVCTENATENKWNTSQSVTETDGNCNFWKWEEHNSLRVPAKVPQTLLVDSDADCKTHDDKDGSCATITTVLTVFMWVECSSDNLDVYETRTMSVVMGYYCKAYLD